MSYAILRTAKLKNFGAIAASAQHNYRERQTDNADPSRTAQNQHLVCKSTEELMQRFKERMPEKHRKNAVLGIEYLITASPDKWQDPNFNDNKYFTDALRWLETKHGKENVIAGSVHRDEKTPHAVVYVIPLDKRGKLNAREFLGGRKVLAQMQTDFHEKVAQKYGLERGVERSTAKHQSIKRFYSLIEKPLPKLYKVPEKPKKPFLAVPGTQSAHEYEKRLTARYSALEHNSKAASVIYAHARAHAITSKEIVEKRSTVKKVFEYTQHQVKSAEKLAKEAVDTIKARFDMFRDSLESERKRTAKAVSVMLKKAYSPQELADTLGLKVHGRADIFELMQKAKKARSFVDAVEKVAEAVEAKNDAAWQKLGYTRSVESSRTLFDLIERAATHETLSRIPGAVGETAAGNVVVASKNGKAVVLVDPDELKILDEESVDSASLDELKVQLEQYISTRESSRGLSMH